MISVTLGQWAAPLNHQCVAQMEKQGSCCLHPRLPPRPPAAVRSSSSWLAQLSPSVLLNEWTHAWDFSVIVVMSSRGAFEASDIKVMHRRFLCQPPWGQARNPKSEKSEIIRATKSKTFKVSAQNYKQKFPHHLSPKKVQCNPRCIK